MIIENDKIGKNPETRIHGEKDRHLSLNPPQRMPYHILRATEELKWEFQIPVI
jgi:hypothetical protein